MAKIIIGTETLSQNPGKMTIIRPDLPCSYAETYSSVAYFDWPATVIGKVVTLEWNLLNSDDWEDLHTIWEAGASVVFNPQDGESKTYNVQILDIQGKYCAGTGTSGYVTRREVVIKLLIMSEA